MRRIIPFIFLFSNYCLIYSQQLTLKSYSETNGLISDEVNDITQDKDGYMWFSTYGGLIKFDGIKLKRLGKDEGLPVESNTDDILIDKNNLLWVCSPDTCLFIIRNQNSKYPQTYYFSNILHPEAIIEDATLGDIWIADSDRLYQIRNYKIVNQSKFSSENNPIHITAIKQSENKIYLCTANSGLIIFDYKKNIKIVLKKQNGLLSDNCSSVYIDKETLWIGPDIGVSVLNQTKTEKTFNYGVNNSVNNINSSKDGNIWITTMSGVNIYRNLQLINHYGGENNDLLAINFNKVFFDREDDAWLAMGGGGVYHIYNKYLTRFKIFDSEVEPSYGFVQENDSTYYLSYFFTDMYVRLYKTGSFFSFDSLPSRHHFPSYSTKDTVTNTIYIAGFDGIVKIKDGIAKHYINVSQFSDSKLINPWFDYEEQALYIGSVDGITKFKNDEFKKIYYYKNGLKEQIVIYNAVKVDSFTFICTNKGLKGLENDIITDYVFFDNIKFTNDDCRIITKDINNNVWFCVDNDIIIRLWIENNAIKYKKYNTYSLYKIKGPFNIFSHKNYFWIRNINKLYQFDLSSIYKEKPQLHFILDQYDGLKSEAAYYTTFTVDNKDNLYLLGTYGLFHLNYKDYKKNSVETVNHITDIKVNDGDYDISNNSIFFRNTNDQPVNLELTAKAKKISFEFIGISHRSQWEVKYKTKLEGYDESWGYPTETPGISYTNLAPGKYTFQFISSNNDGVWSTTPYSYSFTLLPAWYQTWWFKLIISFIVAAIIYMVFLWRINIIKKEKNRQIKLTQDILASQEQERKRIAQELHDGVGQELSMLKVSVEKSNDHIILNKVDKIIEDIRFLSRNIHPHYFEKLGLTKAVEMIVDETNKLEKIFWVHELENVDQYFNTNQQLMLYRVVQECMNNTIKHSGAKNAKVTVQKNESSIHITIQDNGVGFQTDQTKLNSLGLSTIRERVRSLDGTVTVKSKPGSGTQTDILIPIKA